MQTFINLPATIAETVSRILSRSDARRLALQARELHARYMQGANPLEPHIQKPEDCIAYLALRFPATFAQITGALSQIAERTPGWRPKSVLELGCGPGTAIWAAKSVWPTLTTGTGVDQEGLFLKLAEEIGYGAHKDMSVMWTKSTISKWLETADITAFDLIIVANTFNEMAEEERTAILAKIMEKSAGVVVVIEPGTAMGYGIIRDVASIVAPTRHLIAPYVNGSFVPSEDYWIHFSQRFQRPEYQRRIRQSMRTEGTLMASDWEDAKYSFVAWGNVPHEKPLWGVAIGSVEKQKGLLTIPVLTKDGIITARVLKRNKDIYNEVKNFRWGALLESPIQTS